MDAEADQLCGGDNGHRKRGLTTCVGTLTLRIPKLRSGSFFPEDVLVRYQRVDGALVAAAAEIQVLLGGKDERALRRRAPSGNRRSRQAGAGGGGSPAAARIRPRACGQGRAGIGYQPYSGF